MPSPPAAPRVGQPAAILFAEILDCQREAVWGLHHQPIMPRRGACPLVEYEAAPHLRYRPNAVAQDGVVRHLGWCTKASGILMVDGVLYLWVRNVGNAQLAWSRDRGKTW